MTVTPFPPTGWRNLRLRYVLTFPSKSEIAGLPGSTLVSFVPMEAIGEWGGIRPDQEKVLEDVQNGYSYFRDGDVLVAKITPCFENGKGALAKDLTNGIGFGTTELHVLRARQSIDPRYLFYLTCTHQFRRLGEGSMYGAGGQKRVPENFIKDLVHPIPPLEEQTAIACFLNRQTTRIDELIAKKERLVQLVEEERSAILDQACTRPGFVDLVPRWTRIRIGRVLKLQRGFDISGANETTEGVPVFSSGGLSGYSRMAAVKGPGVIVGRKGTLGTVHYSETDYWPHDTTLWVREFRSNHPRYVYYFLKHMRLERFDVGAANPTLNRNHVHPLVTDWPNIEYQVEAASQIDLLSRKAGAATAKVTEAIGKLREYRTALISAAVTGQIDLRTYRKEPEAVLEAT